MSASIASTSGRVLEATRLGAPHFIPSSSRSSQRSKKGRASSGESMIVSQALVLPQRLQIPLLRGLHKLFKFPQVSEFVNEAMVVGVAVDPTAKQEPSIVPQIADLVRTATFAAVKIGLTLTGLAFQLAKKVVWYGTKGRPIRQEVQSQAAAAKFVLKQAATKQAKLARERLLSQGRDEAFMGMLQLLDKCYLDHEAKWALVQKHTADKAEFSQQSFRNPVMAANVTFKANALQSAVKHKESLKMDFIQCSERLQQLFTAATQSKTAVETLLRPNASRSEINSFWKSSQTAELIAEEDALKSLVFAQMLYG